VNELVRVGGSGVGEQHGVRSRERNDRQALVTADPVDVRATYGYLK